MVLVAGIGSALLDRSLIVFASLFPPRQLLNTHNTVEEEHGVSAFNSNRGVALTHRPRRESNGGHLSGSYPRRRNVYEFRGTYKVLNVEFEGKEEEKAGAAATKRVVLVRHGQSTWNEEGRIQGSSNFSLLTHKGEMEAQNARQMLLKDTFDVCFHSPLARSKRTAEIIWDSRKLEMIPEHDLREIDLYSFQGLLKHEGKERFGEAYRQWQKDAANFTIDGHYPVRELWARAKNCWTKILSHNGRSILVVAHNAVNQALVATAIGLGPEYFRRLLQSNCGITVLDFTTCSSFNCPPYICLNRLNQIHCYFK